MSFGETFKALSDPARRQILELLKKGPLYLFRNLK